MAVGPTFIADHSQSNGDIAESWIDHVYHSKELESLIQTEIKIKPNCLQPSDKP